MRCFRSEGALSSPRLLRPLQVMLAGLAILTLLAGCRFGGAVSYFDEDNAIEQAVGALKARIGAPVRVLNLSVTPDQITLRAQDAAIRRRDRDWRRLAREA